MALYKEKVNYKLRGRTGGYLPHVDFYHKMDAATLAREFLLDDADVCVCMIAVDDMDEGNGCPFVAPGWHTSGPRVFRGALESLSLGDKAEIAGVPVVDPATLPWVPVTLKAGDVLIYGNNMPHKSEANASDRDRRALFAVYSDLKHGEQRTAYYAAEAAGRRADGSGREKGKPCVSRGAPRARARAHLTTPSPLTPQPRLRARRNGFFTGDAVHVSAAASVGV
jgi:hypothetical protein